MLKTDYKDDLFEGERKYKMTTDTEGKVTLRMRPRTPRKVRASEHWI